MSKPIILCLISLLYSGLVESGGHWQFGGCRTNWLGEDLRFCQKGGAPWKNCITESEPCKNQCLRTSPVLSKNGKICSKCDIDEVSGDVICPKCKWKETWCPAEKLCKNQTQPCNGKCPLSLYPVLNGESCGYCDPRTSWFCPSTDSCIDATSPCQQQCKSTNYHYCSINKSCVRSSDPCGETCFGKSFDSTSLELRDLIYCNITNSCLKDTQLCGSKCPKNRNFCKLHSRCQGKDDHKYNVRSGSRLGHCPCQNDRWGCTTNCPKRVNGWAEICNNSCHLKYEETMKDMEKICIKTNSGHFQFEASGLHKLLNEGDCHPSYKLCHKTATCIPNEQNCV